MVEATGQEAADETMSAMTNTSMEPMLPEQRAGHQGALTASGFLPEKELRWQWTEGVMSFFLKKKKKGRNLEQVLTLILANNGTEKWQQWTRATVANQDRTTVK